MCVALCPFTLIYAYTIEHQQVYFPLMASSTVWAQKLSVVLCKTQPCRNSRLQEAKRGHQWEDQNVKATRDTKSQ